MDGTSGDLFSNKSARQFVGGTEFDAIIQIAGRTATECQPEEVLEFVEETPT